ncbi:MAG: hypothetical protein ABI442_22785, partial [Gemmatimonadaceae bacterium]
MAASRRFIAGLIRFGLVILAGGICFAYIARKVSGRTRTSSIHFRAQMPVTDSLGPGDLRIYSRDSSVDIVLLGTNLLAGLSPKMQGEIKAKMEAKTAKDTSSFGGSIAQLVTKSVAGAIGTHASFPLADIREVRYDDGHIVFDANDGTKHDLLGNANVNGEKV